MLDFIEYKVKLHYKGTEKTYEQWLNTPHTLLCNCTPQQFIERGYLDQVYEVIKKATEHK
jgi:hypothetical protein